MSLTPYRNPLSGLTARGKQEREAERQREAAREEEEDRYQDTKTRIHNAISIAQSSVPRLAVLDGAIGVTVYQLGSEPLDHQLRGMQAMLSVGINLALTNYMEGRRR